LFFELFQCKITTAGGVKSTSKCPLDAIIRLFQKVDLIGNSGFWYWSNIWCNWCNN